MLQSFAAVWDASRTYSATPWELPSRCAARSMILYTSRCCIASCEAVAPRVSG